MGVITALLIAGGILDSTSFTVPVPVILSAASAIALGTFFGGNWQIVKTMAFKLTNLRPYQGFCAETGGGAILAVMALYGIPVKHYPCNIWSHHGSWCYQTFFCSPLGARKADNLCLDNYYTCKCDNFCNNTSNYKNNS